MSPLPISPDDRAEPWYIIRDTDGWRPAGGGAWRMTDDPPRWFATEAAALAFAAELGLSPAARLETVVMPAMRS